MNGDVTPECASHRGPMNGDAPSPWIIEAEGLSKVYRLGSSEVHALRDANLQIRPGEFIALMGASGSGKSTLLQLLGCLEKPSAGRCWIEGQDVSGLSSDARARLRGRRIGFVFQNFNLLPRLTARENVALPLLYQRRADAQAQALAALQRVGLAKRSHHLPTELSGGERQRVAIARALVAEPAILLADEPTGSLDSKTGAEVMKLLSELWQEGRTLLLVTHDPKVAAYAGRVLWMQDGVIGGQPDDAAQHV